MPVTFFRVALLCGTLGVAGLGLSAVAGGESLSPALETLRIAGSGYTMPRFTSRWAEAFSARTGVRVEIEGHGTSTGPPALIRGQAEIASMTRPMSNAELEAFYRRFGHLPTPIPVAADAVAVFVNERNPLERLTLTQVDAIFSKTRRCGGGRDARVWGDVGLEGEWADRMIGLYGRRPGSGTGIYFRDAALCGGEFKDSMHVSPGRESAALAIAEAVYGIGFGSFADRRQGMKALALASREGKPYGRADSTDIHSRVYPLGRELYFYVNRLPRTRLNPTTEGFITYALSENGQALIEETGYLRLPPAVVEETLASPAFMPAPQ